MSINTKINTGLDNLDRELGGGLTQGTITTITTPADSQGEVMFDRFTDLYPTLYITLEQSPVVLNRRVSQQEAKTTLNEQDHIRVENLSQISDPEEVIDEVDTVFENFESIVEDANVDEYTVIIDPIDTVEKMGDEYINELFSVLHEHLYRKDVDVVRPCVVYLHALDQADTTARNITHHLSDTTMRIYRQRNGVDMEYFLFVLKNRFGESLDSGLKIRVGNSISVDNSRNI